MSKLVVAKTYFTADAMSPTTYKAGRVLEVVRKRDRFYKLDVTPFIIVEGFGLNTAIPTENLKTTWFTETVVTKTVVKKATPKFK